MRLKTTKFLVVFLLFIFVFPLNKLKAQPGLLGAGTITGTNVVMNRATFLTSNATAGTTTLTVDNSALSGTPFSGNLGAGDLIMIIQMQGASINTSNSASYGEITSYNNAGLYEFRCVQSVPNGTTIVVTVPLSNSYTATGNVQVIRVPRYTSFSLAGGNSIRPANWNGQTGGITVIEISGNATINGTITAEGRGFRGGALDNSSQAAGTSVSTFLSGTAADGGEKGEGIAGYQTTYDALGGRYCRGAPANGGGGGNSHNAGGGGGANAGVVNAWNGLGNPDNSIAGWTTAWNLEGGTFSANTSSGGGRGGYTYGANNRNAVTEGPGLGVWGGNSRQNVGGYGGRPLDYSTGRLFIGGGGGAGDGNNNASNAGARGGGWFLLYVTVTLQVVVL